MWFLHNPGLLGINARNLLYIRAYNPEKAIMMADSKLKTKHFLSARGIPVAKLYGVIRSKKEFGEFNWESLPAPFVVKPDAGYGGEGIIVVEKREKEAWITSDGEILPLREIERHISDILDGRYSIADLTGCALFEKKLEAPEFLAAMSYKGLPDIRIIVHNLIPVMAMLRLPTKASHGKANLHMGGIGVGIDIATGELTHIAQYNRIIDQIPDFGSVDGLKIPQWKELLLIASRVQQITNLGFAAVDLTLDKDVGPVLLEINARAGLSVQIANMAPLRRRLERIEGIKVGTPEKGVRIAQDIFGARAEKEISPSDSKTVVGSYELAEIIGKDAHLKVMAKMDPHAAKTVLDKWIAEKAGLDETGKCKFTIAGKRLITVVGTNDLGNEIFKMVVGKRDLNEFWIDPQKPVLSPGNLKKSVFSSFFGKNIQDIDHEIAEIDSQIHLLANLRPVNLQEERDKFLADITYNPQFEYGNLSFNPDELSDRLKRLEYPDSPIGILLNKKAEEIKLKIDLLKARGTESFINYSALFMPAPDDEVFREALEEAKKMPEQFPEEGALLTADEARVIFEEKLINVGLTDWTVQLKSDMVADAVVGKHGIIFIRSGATFTPSRLKGTIAHEIETHVFTAMNGARQPYKIFQRGFAGYLMTEEGLAIHNQERTEAIETPKMYWPASSVIGIYTALHGSFTETYATVLRYGFGSQRALRVAIKAKRGLRDTSKPGAFTKDMAYFLGRSKVRAFIKEGGDLRDLYLGKVNIDDLPLIKKIRDIKLPLYLPDSLKM